jgi:murein DD-endopeptidase MepM/ murein hydrolase activator NlpD
VQLRSLKLPPNITNYLDELNTRLGSGATRALNISKAWADIKQKGYQNEIKSLEQGLTLMNKQREVAEAMSSVAAARRALAARSFELGVQVAASPEAKAAAEARLADVKLRQEKEAIAERRGILQTERELQQRQMLIQEKQIKIQQEQLKIQLAEARADQVRVAEATQAVLKARGNTSPRSPEWQGFTSQLNVLAAEGTRNVARINGAREALRLAFEAEGQLGTINGLESQRLNLQGQQLDIQGQSAQYTREQQALLAQISQAELRITNELTRATNQQNAKKRAIEDQSAEIDRQNTLLERQGQLEKAQAELAMTRAKAEVQTAERLAELAELQDRARSGGGTASVIEAQIAAAAAGVSGMQSAADAQQQLYEAKERQMTREHELQQRQLQVQHEREASEVRIQRLRYEGQKVDNALQRARILADISKLTLSQRRDAIAPQIAGASRVPSLESGVVGGIGNMLPGTKGGPNINEGVGYGRGRLHAGRDLGLDIGDPIHARRGGRITQAYSSGFGKVGGAVVIKYDDGMEGVYGHTLPSVRTGQSIAAGQRIATVAPDGNNTHLHYELRDQMGRLLEPLNHIRESLRVPRQTAVAADSGRGAETGAASPQARVTAAVPSVTAVGRTVAAAGGTVAPSTAVQAQEYQQRIDGLNESDALINKLIAALDDWLEKMGNIQAVQQENLTEQQLADRAQLLYENTKAQLTNQVMRTPEGRMAIATGDAVSGSISGSLSGALQALLNGGDVRQAVSSALAQAGQSLMQATLDALLNPLLAQLQGGLVKAITGIDIEGRAQQVAATSLQGAATAQQGAAATLNQAGGTLFAAANALLSAAGVQGAAAGAGAVGNAGSMWASLAAKLPSLIGGLGGFTGGLDLAGAFSGTSSLIDFTAAPSLVSGLGSFTPGLAGGGEIQYGLDYLVGEKNAEIVRFNKAGGRVYSNRALTKALGVPFQRTPGGGAAVADGGGDFLGVPFMGAGSTRAASGSRSTPGIPFLKGSSGGGGGGAAAGAAGGAPGAGMARSSSLRLSLETQVINGIEYATVQQVLEAAEAAAQAGRDSAYDGMRNNPSIQTSLGLR